jgi:predicted membrane protein
MIIGFYIALCLFVALLGMNRKWGMWKYFVAYLLLSPFVGILLILATEQEHSEQTQVSEKK